MKTRRVHPGIPENLKRPPSQFSGIPSLIAFMRDCRERGQSWREIASRFEQIAPATLLRIYRDRYEPKRNKTRARLGLPALATAPLCPKCGVVHSRTCRILPEWVNQAADWLAMRQREIQHG